MNRDKLTLLFGLTLVFLCSLIIQSSVRGTFGAKTDVVVWIFDVGQGDAIFIDSPNGQVLIDGGPNEAILEKIGAVMPPWDRTIEYLINTHPHADHVTGLNHILERYSVEHMFYSGQEYGTKTYQEFLRIIDDIGRIPHFLSEIDLSDRAKMTLLYPIDVEEHPENPNDGSLVYLLEAVGVQFLFTGDIGTSQELAIMPYLGDINVLKVGHQGSNTSSSSAFLEHIDPEISVISVGENNYGHPHTAVLERLDEIETEIYRTDLHGDIRLRVKNGRVDIDFFSL
ncbi:MAG: MBL fold metallo-hydrolase [bacterium]|nr:MBL fold metallo-hydrolase [bacterium]MDA1024655.1 MBL fold metallo-hydrolase [bacterium]